MGVVYEAHDSMLEANVALKTLTYVDAGGIYRLKSEFRSLADVGHPNLVRLHELHADDGHWFFTMQLVAGRPFVDHVRGRSPHLSGASAAAATVSISNPTDAVKNAAAGTVLARRTYDRSSIDERALRECLKQLVSGVDAIHRAGKLHRDLKPSNILVTPDGRVLILDFGLVAERRPDAAGGRQPTDKAIIGTPGYMAPEQGRGDRATPASDWYGVGVILYQALTGELPFEGNPLQILNRKQLEDAKAPIELAPDVPADLNRLCVDLLQREPELRPSAAAILQSLDGPASTEKTVEDAPSGVRFEVPPRDSGDTPFIGRKHELDCLQQCLRDIESGKPVIALVMGPSGIGKSALVEHFLRDLRVDPDVVVLTGRCYEREAVPYKALDGVVDALTRYLRSIASADADRVLPRHVHALCRLFPVLERVEVIARIPERSGLPSDPRQLRQLGFSALRELFGRITERHRLVISVDDLQWGDADSFQLLDSVLGAADSPNLLFLGTAWSDEADRGPLVNDLLDPQRGLRNANVRNISVEPLAPSEVTLLVNALSPELPESTSAAIHVESGGNPFFVAELVRHANVTGEGQAIGIDAALATRMSALSPSARSLLDLVAIAARPVDRVTLGVASGLDKVSVSDAIDSLRLTGLVRAAAPADGGATRRRLIRTYHDRIRLAVTDALSTEAQRNGHRRLGEALEQSDAPDPEALHQHFFEAGDPVKASRYALQAAERAGDGLAFDRAAMLYRMAVEHCTDHDERLRLLIQLAETLLKAGRDSDSAQAYLEATRLAVGPEQQEIRKECQRHAAEQLVLSGELEQGMSVLSDVLADVGIELPKSPRRAIAALLWDRAILAVRGLSWTPHRESEIPPEQLALLHAYRVVVLTLGLAQPIYGLRFLTRYVLLALRAGEPTYVAHALAQYGGTMATSGMRGYRAGRTALAESHRAAELLDPSLKWGVALIEGQEGMASLLAGNFADAIAKLTDASDALDRVSYRAPGLHLGKSLTRLLHLSSLRVTGRLGELARICETVRREASRRGDRYTEATTTRMHNVAWLVRDEPEAARKALDAVGWAPLQTGLHVQAVYELRARAEIDLYLAEVTDLPERYADRLRAFDRSMLRSIELDRIATAHVRARLWLHNAELGLDRRRALREAMRWSRYLLGQGPVYAHAYGELVAAAAKWQTGDTPGAIQSLRASIRHCEATTMTAAPSQYRLAEIVGAGEGGALRDRALSWARAEGIVNPARYFHMVAPGFERREDVPQLIAPGQT